jgi:hypothetical protein
MAKGTVEQAPTNLTAMLSESAPELGSDSAAVEFATSVAEVRPQTAAQLGLNSWASSVEDSFKGSPENAQLFIELHRSDADVCRRMAEAVTALPEVGTELLGFRLLAELGHGAFGKVYLAQQGDLASRAVVLKVSPRIDDEARTLAQLQHTNIVPIYSAHRAGPLQAVCMPYFGATTLASVLRELGGRKTLPESGKELVSTIIGRKSTVRERDVKSAQAQSSLEASDRRPTWSCCKGSVTSKRCYGWAAASATVWRTPMSTASCTAI